ncbi:glycosyltransferase family 4 protein [Nesterenkonia ebinurensis]|uniref:glycosyltransferase family 4 protein n=1 Tax=Nesterenkonia ebinurensis TaxID=2608252 RepID=UPI00168B7FFF|nr:glycosyltransferase [Nesterenkonia ebinurensis]
MTRLILHKFDPLTPAPGGIDTCIRGIIKYRREEEILIVGVDGANDEHRKLGAWEDHSLFGRDIRFMPVVRLDPGNQVRKVPHSVRIAAGTLRFRHRLPTPEVVQTHRADLSLLANWLWRDAPFDYFIHTQEAGLLGSDSDSFWKKAPLGHRAIEKRVASRASRVRVFNPSYTPTVQQWNPAARFSPTWWDPELVISADHAQRDPHLLLWVGRLEQPKQPEIAVQSMAALREQHPDEPWRLRIIGTGNRASALEQLVKQLKLQDRIELVGRLGPTRVMEEMSVASTLLMTSVAGYEGFPRVLVEGLASGLIAVTTEGADTGNLIQEGTNGYHAAPDGQSFAERIRLTKDLDHGDAQESAHHLSAPEVIAALYS